MLIDPNTLSNDGTVALKGVYPSADGRFLAYGLASAGSDWVTWKVTRFQNGWMITDVP